MRPQTASNGKLLLFAQWYSGDMVQMMELLKLLSDIEKQQSPFADIIIFPRRDAKWRDEMIPQQVFEKFNAKFITGRRWAHGWPMGPNALAMDAFREAHKRWKSGEWTYSGYMLLESDCVPLQANWIERLLGEWEAQPNHFLGHWIGHGTTPSKSHMNGNLIFHPAFFECHPQMAYGETPPQPWDALWWPLIQTSATPSKLIYSDYRQNTRKNPWRGCDYLWEPKINHEPTNPLYGQRLQPIWIHGTKGIAGMECVRQKLVRK